jgi:hypothetical protein
VLSLVEQLSVLRSHGHGMDDDLVGRAGDEDDDDLQQVAGSIWADDEPPIGVFAEVINGKWVGDCVQDVIVVHAVTSAEGWISTRPNRTTKFIRRQASVISSATSRPYRATPRS